MNEDLNQLEKYNQHYSERDLLKKVKDVAKKAGKEVIRPVLALYYLLQSNEISLKEKALIVGTLGYFILPVDLVPDAILGLGFADDLAALAYVYEKVKANMNESIAQRVEDALQSLGL